MKSTLISRSKLVLAALLFSIIYVAAQTSPPGGGCCGGDGEYSAKKVAHWGVKFLGSGPTITKLELTWKYNGLVFHGTADNSQTATTVSLVDANGVSVLYDPANSTTSIGNLLPYGITSVPLLPIPPSGYLSQAFGGGMVEFDENTTPVFTVEGTSVSGHIDAPLVSNAQSKCGCCEEKNSGQPGDGGPTKTGGPSGPTSGLYDAGSSGSTADELKFTFNLGSAADGVSPGTFSFPKRGPQEGFSKRTLLEWKPNLYHPELSTVVSGAGGIELAYTSDYLADVADISNAEEQVIGYSVRIFGVSNPSGTGLSRFPTDRTTVNPVASWTMVGAVPYGANMKQTVVTRTTAAGSKTWYAGRGQSRANWDLSTADLVNNTNGNPPGTWTLSVRTDTATGSGSRVLTEYGSQPASRVVDEEHWTCEPDAYGAVRLLTHRKGGPNDPSALVQTFSYQASSGQLAMVSHSDSGYWTSFGQIEDSGRVWRVIRQPINNATPTVGDVAETRTLVPDLNIPGEPATTRQYRYGVHLSTTLSSTLEQTIPGGSAGYFSTISENLVQTPSGVLIEKTVSVAYDSEHEPLPPSTEIPPPPVPTLAPTELRGKTIYRSTERGGGRIERMEYSYSKGDYNVATGAFTVNTAGIFLRTEEVDSEASFAAGAFDGIPVVQPMRSHRRSQIQDGFGNVFSERDELATGGGAYRNLSETRTTYGPNDQIATVFREGSAGQFSEVFHAEFTGPLKRAEIDENGIRTEYSNFDGNDNPRTVRRVGVAASGTLPAIEDATTTVVYDALNRVLSRSMTIASSATPIVESTVYDTAGRVSGRQSGGVAVAQAYLVAPKRVSRTYSGGTTEIEEYFADGRLKSRTGTRTIPETYNHGFETVGGAHLEWTEVVRGGPSGQISSKTYVDSEGRQVMEKTPNPSIADAGREIVTKTIYNAACEVERTEVNSTVLSSFTRANLGRVDSSVLRNPQDISIASFQEQVVTPVGGELYEVSSSPQGGYKRQITGLGAGSGYGTLVSHAIQFGRQSSHTLVESFTWADRATKTTREETWSYGESSPTVRISRNGILQSELPVAYTVPVLYATDGAGRVTGVTDPRTGKTKAISYSPTYPSQIASISLTAPNAAGIVETHAEVRNYYPSTDQNAGKLSSVTRLGQTTNYAYNTRGQRTHVWGAQYPLWLEYNDAGQLAKMHTYRTAPANPAALAWGDGDITEWRYYAGSGKLHQKLDAKQRIANTPVTYSYDNFGNVASRTWARGVTTTYGVDLLGQVKSVAYSDGTPAVTRSGNDGDGRYTQTMSEGATWTQTIVPGIDPLGLPSESETDTMSSAVGSSLEHAAYTATRRYNLGGKLTSTQYNTPGVGHTGYQIIERDPVTRVEDVYQNGPGYSAEFRAFEYKESNSEQYAGRWARSRFFTSGSLAELSVGQYRSHDNFDRQSGQYSDVTYQGITGNYWFNDGHSFSYDSQGRRTKDTRNGGTFWDYGYNSKNEVTAGVRKLSDGTPLPGWSFGYEFDDIGNRKTSGQSGASTSYGPTGANELNQYTNKTNPSSVNVTGETGAAGTHVWVASDPPGLNAGLSGHDATLTGHFFHKQIAAGNQAGPGNLKIVVKGGVPPGTITPIESGTILVPPVNETLKYDADGNLTDDGLWHYTWDAENRLTSATTHVGDAGYVDVPASARKKMLYAYDYRSRMVRREVYEWAGTAWSTATTDKTHFVYDGWNLMAELNATGTLIRRYYWGLDLSGTTDGAGGVGGLIAVQHFVGGDVSDFTISFPIYDGNGNILAYYDATTGERVADFAYGPFGETIRATGLRAAELPLRWSTKYTDGFTGHKYYGYRWLGDGRWLSRDPIGEWGGGNLYGTISNRPVDRFDVFGLVDSYDKAIQEAKRSIGSATRSSRESDYNQFQRTLGLNASDFSDLSSKEGRLRNRALNNSLFNVILNGVTGLDFFLVNDVGLKNRMVTLTLGVEYGAVVYCCNKDNKKDYQVSPLRKGKSAGWTTNYVNVSRGSFPLQISFPNCANPKIVAHLHSHNVGTISVVENGSSIPAMIIGRRNSPSDADKSGKDEWKDQSGIRFYIVDEANGEFELNEY